MGEVGWGRSNGSGQAAKPALGAVVAATAPSAGFAACPLPSLLPHPTPPYCFPYARSNACGVACATPRAAAAITTAVIAASGMTAVAMASSHYELRVPRYFWPIEDGTAILVASLSPYGVNTLSTFCAKSDLAGSPPGELNFAQKVDPGPPFAQNLDTLAGPPLSERWRSASFGQRPRSTAHQPGRVRRPDLDEPALQARSESSSRTGLAWSRAQA